MSEALSESEEVISVGKTSGPNTGVVSHIEPCVKHPEHDRERIEYVVARRDWEPFAQPGDSGSFVMNSAGQSLGLLLGARVGGIMLGRRMLHPSKRYLRIFGDELAMMLLFEEVDLNQYRAMQVTASPAFNSKGFWCGIMIKVFCN